MRTTFDASEAEKNDWSGERKKNFSGRLEKTGLKL